MTDEESRYRNRIADTERKQSERWYAKHPPLDALTGLKPVSHDARNPWHEIPEAVIRAKTTVYLRAHGIRSRREIRFFAEMLANGWDIETALRKQNIAINTDTRYRKDFEKIISELVNFRG